MIVYRVEDPKSGKGIFSSGIANKARITTTTSSKNPEPEDDGINIYTLPNHRFGFKSISQLKSWFGKTNLDKLSLTNAKIVVYNVYSKEDVQIGKKQLIFNIKKAKKQKILEISNI